MDPITVAIIGLWAFNAGAGTMLLAKKLEKETEKLDGINDAFAAMDLSASWAKNIEEK